MLNSVDVPHGYSRMTAVDEVALAERDGNRLVLVANVKGADGKSRSSRFEAMLNQFVERDIDRNHHNRVEPLVLDNGSETLMVDCYSITMRKDSITWASISGILFSK